MKVVYTGVRATLALPRDGHIRGSDASWALDLDPSLPDVASGSKCPRTRRGSFRGSSAIGDGRKRGSKKHGRVCFFVAASQLGTLSVSQAERFHTSKYLHTCAKYWAVLIPTHDIEMYDEVQWNRPLAYKKKTYSKKKKKKKKKRTG